jgi:hypothetical protein
VALFCGVLEKHLHGDFGEEGEYRYISQHKGLLFLLFFTVQAGEGVKAPQQAGQTGVRHVKPTKNLSLNNSPVAKKAVFLRERVVRASKSSEGAGLP